MQRTKLSHDSTSMVGNCVISLNDTAHALEDENDEEYDSDKDDGNCDEDNGDNDVDGDNDEEGDAIACTHCIITNSYRCMCVCTVCPSISYTVIEHFSQGEVRNTRCYAKALKNVFLESIHSMAKEKLKTSAGFKDFKPLNFTLGSCHL